MDELLQLIQNVGFPAAVTAYLLYSRATLDKQITANLAAISENIRVIQDKLCK